MEFAASELAQARKRRAGSARRAAIAEFGGGDKFAAHLGVNETAISMALNDRPDRPWREEWTAELLASPDVTIATKRALADALLGGAGLVAAPQEAITVVGVANRALAELERFGAHGQPIADELRGLLLSALAAGRLR